MKNSKNLIILVEIRIQRLLGLQYQRLMNVIRYPTFLAVSVTCDLFCVVDSHIRPDVIIIRFLGVLCVCQVSPGQLSCSALATSGKGPWFESQPGQFSHPFARLHLYLFIFMSYYFVFFSSVIKTYKILRFTFFSNKRRILLKK